MDMQWTTVFAQIFEVCLIPLLGVLTTYLVKFIKIKAAEIADKTNNDMAKKYIEMLGDTITNCVIATNQTYVEALKKQGKFDEAAQKIAFEKTYQAVLGTLSDEAKVYLANIYGDLNALLTNRIEAEVNKEK